MFYEKEADERYHFLLARRTVSENDEHYLSPAHFHDSLEFLFVTDGEVLATVNGEEKKVSGGEILFVDSCDIHTLSFICCTAYSLVFSRSFCGQFCEGKMTLPTHPVCDKTRFESIASSLSSFYDSGKEKNKLFCESLIAYLLGELSECNEYVPRLHDKPREAIIGVIDYFNNNYQNDLTLSGVAAEFGYASSYFSALFNRFIRMSFNDYLNYVRYCKALELLRERRGMKITDAAMRCGFGSMNTFYRTKSRVENSSFGKNRKI